MSLSRYLAVVFFLSPIVLALPVNAQEVIQSRGVDQTVQYEDLKRFGPWDDRNYQLKRTDLDLLAPNEAELVIPIPAFFRVLLRKNWPTLPREGPVQYPRNALQIFLQKFGGYLIDGKIYTKVNLQNGRYVVLMENGTPMQEKSRPPN